MGAVLGVNIDHVATVRQARYARNAGSINVEPHPVEAALAAERGGAVGITAHLRQDRRHVVDRDIFRLKESIGTKLNLEMGNSPEIVAIALQVLPADVCLVPESREEVTTEGGLDCITHRAALERGHASEREGIGLPAGGAHGHVGRGGRAADEAEDAYPQPFADIQCLKMVLDWINI